MYDHSFTLGFSLNSARSDASDISEAEFRKAVLDRLKSPILEAVMPPDNSSFEGWFISNGSDDLDQIQKCQETNIFATDQQAWAYVLTRAIYGSTFHKQALQRIETNNPADYALMMQSICGEAL